jgi:hypothetical protein
MRPWPLTEAAMEASRVTRGRMANMIEIEIKMKMRDRKSEGSMISTKRGEEWVEEWMEMSCAALKRGDEDLGVNSSDRGPFIGTVTGVSTISLPRTPPIERTGTTGVRALALDSQTKRTNHI